MFIKKQQVDYFTHFDFPQVLKYPIIGNFVKTVKFVLATMMVVLAMQLFSPKQMLPYFQSYPVFIRIIDLWSLNNIAQLYRTQRNQGKTLYKVLLKAHEVVSLNQMEPERSQKASPRYFLAKVQQASSLGFWVRQPGGGGQSILEWQAERKHNCCVSTKNISFDKNTYFGFKFNSQIGISTEIFC